MDVLVVEDSPEYAQIVSAVLAEAGHRVRSASTIAGARASLSAAPPDLVILDLTLPDGDGLDLCRRIHEASNAYIVMLTGRDDEVDKLVGFRLGADDYITKPFSPRELAARVEAIARRPRGGSETVRSELVVHGLTIRPMSREVLAGTTPIELTRIEFDLLELFVSNPHQVFSRTQLLERVWGGEWFGDDHVVDVHIANMRKKLAVHVTKNPVRTVRGIGYGLAG